MNAPTRAIRAYTDALAALHDCWLSLAVTATWLSRCTQPPYQEALTHIPIAPAEDMLRLIAQQAGALQQHASTAADLTDAPVIAALYAASRAAQPAAAKVLGSAPWHALPEAPATYLLGQTAQTLCGVQAPLIIAAARPPNCTACQELLT